MDDSLLFRRRLRRDATDAEALLWTCLRGRRLAGLKFRRQHPFGPFVLDFFCADYNIAIEIDGGQHFHPDEIERDQRRTGYLAGHGIQVLRFTNTEVLIETAAVVEAILLALRPGPSP